MGCGEHRLVPARGKYNIVWFDALSRCLAQAAVSGCLAQNTKSSSTHIVASLSLWFGAVGHWGACTDLLAGCWPLFMAADGCVTCS